MFSWLVILPPVLVLAAALYTRNMILSFFIGIVSGAFIASQGALVPTATLIIKRFSESSGLNNIYSLDALWNSWSICILLFLVFLGILVVILQHSGSTQAFVQIAQRKVHSARQTEITSLLLSLLFFIDDYFSALTVGSIMRPLAAKYRVHPVKMAFLVTAMASPITILFPISSWVGEIALQIKQAGIGTHSGAIFIADPFYLFLHAIPFIFYALLIIIGTWYIVLRGISYGPMQRHEREYKLTPHHAPVQHSTTTASLIDFVIPLVLLIVSVFVVLLKTGGFILFGGVHTFFDALKHGAVHQALLVSGFTSTLAALLIALARKSITKKTLFPIVWQGIWLMLPSLIMLINAWTLSIILKQDLQTGTYIASLFSTALTSTVFPVVCFIFAALMAFMAGSAWATIGLIFPIAIPMITVLAHVASGTDAAHVALLLPVIGAVLSGSIMGTHFSLLADNPIMAAASCGASHLALIKSMSWYIMPIGIATAISYGTYTFFLAFNTTFVSYGIALGSGILSMIVLLELMQKLFAKK